MRSYLGGRQIATETVNADEEAPNVVGRVDGGNGGRHIVFNAHMDTMEAGDESAWTVPVLRLTRRDGRLYGLGMGNMKGALAAMCLATVILKRHRAAWNGRLSMTAVSDEVMFGERGTVFLLNERPDLAGDYLISGEGPGLHGLRGGGEGTALARHRGVVVRRSCLSRAARRDCRDEARRVCFRASMPSTTSMPMYRPSLRA